MAGVYGYGPIISNILPVVVIGVFAVYIIALLFGILKYILMSVGLYSIAKRRSLSLYGMAWIPIGRAWIMGSIADDYNMKAKSRKSRHGNWLLVLEVILFMTSFSFAALLFYMIILKGVTGDVTPLTVALFVGLIEIVAVLNIAVAILKFISLYKIYRSARPDCAVTFTVLSIIIRVTQPFFVFVCRKRDDGMAS